MATVEFAYSKRTDRFETRRIGSVGAGWFPISARTLFVPFRGVRGIREPTHEHAELSRFIALRSKVISKLRKRVVSRDNRAKKRDASYWHIGREIRLAEDRRQSLETPLGVSKSRSTE